MEDTLAIATTTRARLRSWTDGARFTSQGSWRQQRSMWAASRKFVEGPVKRVFAVIGIMVMAMIGGSRALALEAEQVRTTIKRVGDWQLANPVEFGNGQIAS